MKVKNPASRQSLAKLYKSDKGADVEFVLKSKLSGGEARVPAHKAILAASSPVFDRMFFGALKEGAEVKVTDVSFEAFCEFLQFFYVDEMELSETNIYAVFKMVDKYDVHGSLSVCEYLFKNGAITELFCPYLDLALTHNYPKELIKNFEDTISTKADDIFKTSSFRRSSAVVLKKILEMDKMDCTEFSIFAAAISWAKQQCESKQFPASPNNVKTELGELLSLIRFPTMTAEEFAKCNEQCMGLLDADVLLDILQYILVKRRITYARNFNQTARLKSEFSVSFWREAQLFECTSTIIESTISFIADKNVCLHYFDFVVPSRPLYGNIFFNNFEKQYVSDNSRSVYSSLRNFYVYRVNLHEPRKCETYTQYNFRIVLDASCENYNQMSETKTVSIEGVQFEFKNKNLFVKEMGFKKL